MSVQFYPLAGCQASAAAMQTVLASSKLRLFKDGFTPTPATPRADYLTNECDFDGYPAGGGTLTTWNNPILSPGAGYQIGSPLYQFAWAHVSADVGNIVKGGWLEDSATKVRLAFIFDAPIPMQQAGQGIPLNLILPFLTGT